MSTPPRLRSRVTIHHASVFLVAYWVERRRRRASLPPALGAHGHFTARSRDSLPLWPILPVLASTPPAAFDIGA